MADKQRLDKFLATVGVVPRSQAKRLLKTQLVMVNGVIVIDPSIKIDPEKDKIIYDQEQLSYKKDVYFMLHKPAGIISTVSDELARETVISLIDTHRKIFPVGRLDKDTKGLILLTTDGELTHKLIHPKFHVPKIYHLTITGAISPEQIEKFQQGVILDNELTLPSTVKILKEAKKETRVEVILHEGRFRQIRRTCEILGIDLLDLKRVQFGPIKLGRLKEGSYRELTKREVSLLKKVAEKK